PERLVGIGLGRSAGFVVAVLGCWRAGAAFLPLDARWPVDRLAFVLPDSGPSLVGAAGGTAAAVGRAGVRGGGGPAVRGGAEGAGGGSAGWAPQPRRGAPRGSPPPLASPTPSTPRARPASPRACWSSTVAS